MMLFPAFLGGLGPEYDPVVVTITAKQGFISLPEVQYLLMSYEGRLAQHNTAATIDLTNASAHYSSSQQNYNNKGGRGYPNNNRGRFRGRSRRRYGGRGGPRLFCQLCVKSGHVVATCYHRFDQNFQGINQQQQQHFQQQQEAPNQGVFQAHMTQAYQPPAR
ncbi:hypothetical protein ACOSQ3_032523 [Xanthoceras sorbifolium]